MTQSMVSAIALDVDFINILSEGYILTERRKTKPSFQAGDILGVKETWALGWNGKCYYKADGDRPLPWKYSNQMPERYIKRYVRIVSIEEIEYLRYLQRINGKEYYYNGRAFSCKDCPKDRWFRPARNPELPAQQKVWVITYEMI